MRRTKDVTEDARGEREFRFLIEGLELEELKRHWHDLPEECASLQPKIQRYQSKRPLVLAEWELEWVLSVLDAVLTDQNGYPLDYPPGTSGPWPLEYVSRDDPRCVALQSLHDRLRQAYERDNG